jgi:hypothetical protein
MACFIIEHVSLVKKKEREDDVIQSARRWLEFILGANASGEEYPDKIERRKPEVDRAFFIKNKKYALEHTCLEAFPNELNSDGLWNGDFGSRINELADEMNSSLSLPYDLELTFPNKIGVNKKNLSRFLTDVKEWIFSQSALLGESFPVNIAMKRFRIANYNVKLRLVRYRPLGENTKGRLRCIRIAKSDETYDRRTIVEKAFLSKVKKFTTHKDKGARTVLVLEWRYRIPTPCSPIIYAHKILQESYRQLIDMVILVGIDDKEWSIKYTEVGLKISNKELMSNWWLYNWQDDRIRKYIN